MHRFPIYDRDTFETPTQNGPSDLTNSVERFYQEYAENTDAYSAGNLSQSIHSDMGLQVAQLCWAFVTFQSGDAFAHLNSELDCKLLGQRVSQLAALLNLPALTEIAQDYLSFIEPLSELFEIQAEDHYFEPFKERIEKNYISTKLLIGSQAEIERYINSLSAKTRQKLSEWRAISVSYAVPSEMKYYEDLYFQTTRQLQALEANARLHHIPDVTAIHEKHRKNGPIFNSILRERGAKQVVTHSDWAIEYAKKETEQIADALSGLTVVNEEVVNFTRSNYVGFAPDEIYQLLNAFKAEERLHWVHLKLAVLLIENDLFQVWPSDRWREQVKIFAGQIAKS